MENILVSVTGQTANNTWGEFSIDGQTANGYRIQRYVKIDGVFVRMVSPKQQLISPWNLKI